MPTYPLAYFSGDEKFLFFYYSHINVNKLSHSIQNEFVEYNFSLRRGEIKREKNESSHLLVYPHNIHNSSSCECIQEAGTQSMPPTLVVGSQSAALQKPESETAVQALQSRIWVC